MIHVAVRYLCKEIHAFVAIWLRLTSRIIILTNWFHFGCLIRFSW